MSGPEGDLDNIDWRMANVGPASEDISVLFESEMAKLKQAPGEDMVIVASAQLAQRFGNAGLVDPLPPVRPPDDPGQREALLRECRRSSRARARELKRYPEGAVLLVYDVTG